MRSARLEMALETGALVVPDAGTVAVYQPRVGDDLAALPKDRVRVVTGFKPDHDYFAAQGYLLTGDAPFAAAIVCLPRSKAEALALIARAMAEVVPGGPVMIDGQKTDGVDAILKQCRAAHLFDGESFSKAHGKAFVMAAAPAPADWQAVASQLEDGFQTLPGVFSADGPDRGSVLLAAALPAKLPNRIGDLGAGWGYLSRAILARVGVKELDLVEADAVALDCARVNITDPRARFHWADATTFRAPKLWDAVVMNPPFHAGRDADPGLGMAFLKAAQRGLAPNGVLWLVANRHLAYHATLTALFREVEDVGGDGTFRVTCARYPIRSRP
jgi:16S rRNA (guanine1207-N2)-methyltransferase